MDLKICLLSDIHANHIAFQKVLDSAASEKADQYWFLGDLVGRGPDPVSILAWLNQNVSKDNWIMGNHEGILAGHLEKGVDPLTMTTIIHHRELVAIKSWMDELLPTQFKQPGLTRIKTDIDEAYIILEHGTHNDPMGKHYEVYDHLTPWGDLKEEFEALADKSSSYKHIIKCFGHTHLPTLVSSSRGGKDILPVKIEPFRSYPLDLDRLWLINPGSVGCPRDLDPRASYAILEFGKNKTPTVMFNRVDYDMKKLQDELDLMPYPFMNSFDRFFTGNHSYGDIPDDWKKHFLSMKEVKKNEKK